MYSSRAVGLSVVISGTWGAHYDAARAVSATARHHSISLSPVCHGYTQLPILQGVPSIFEICQACSVNQGDKGVDSLRIELASTAAQQLLERGVDRELRTVWPVAGHGVESI